MAIVDAGGKVSRESTWTMSAAGFAWGPWVSLKRKWTDEDTRRDVERDFRTDPPIEPSGPAYRSYHTLCETVMFTERVPMEWHDVTDWIDVTDRFKNGSPKSYLEHTYVVREPGIDI